MDTYITITGMNFCFGVQAFKVGQKVLLEKDENNEFDSEAIAVKNESSMKIGHVANSVRTVAKGTHSAGYVSFLIGEISYAEVMFITDQCIIAKLIKVDDIKC